MTCLIDCHSHHFPSWYLELLEERDRPPRVARGRDGGRVYQAFDARAPEEVDGPTGQPVHRGFWSPEEKLAFMDRMGIQRALVSVGNPWADIFTPERSRLVADRLNEDLTELASRHRDRIAVMGVLPNSTGQAIVETIDRIGSRSAMAGVIVGTRIGNTPLDSPSLEPVWARLVEHDLTVFVHPSEGLCGSAEFQGHGPVLPLGAGFLVEVSTAVLRLALSGALVRQPRLRLFLPHGGGVLPIVASRVRAVAATRSRELGETIDQLRQACYVDSITLTPAADGLISSTFGAHRTLLGSDHPFLVGGEEAFAPVAATFGAEVSQTSTAAAFPRVSRWWTEA